MAVRIRLKRIGRRNRPFYRMCVFDGRTRRDGQPVEELGSYNPRAATLEEKVDLDLKRAWYWISVGAQPSETCRSILSRLGVRKGGPEPADKPAEEPVAAATPAEASAPEAADAGSTGES